jgi:hypothetical protein
VGGAVGHRQCGKVHLGRRERERGWGERARREGGERGRGERVGREGEERGWGERIRREDKERGEDTERRERSWISTARYSAAEFTCSSQFVQSLVVKYTAASTMVSLPVLPVLSLFALSRRIIPCTSSEKGSLPSILIHA